MGTNQRGETTASPATFLSWQSLLEVGWLLAAILPPLVVNPWASQPFEPVKAALLRSVVWLMAGLWLAWRVDVRRDRGPEISDHPLFRPVLAVMAVQALATGFAVDRGLSLWGSYERAQGWLTLISYSLLLLLVAGQLRSAAQGRRLLVAMAATAVPLVAIGMAQAGGWTPLDLFTDARAPVYATLGRSNFLGAYLSMLLPLTLALGITGASLRERWAWGMLLVGEAGTIVLTQARGAWLATATAVALFALVSARPWLRARGRLWQLLAAAAGLGLAGGLGLALWTGAGSGSTAARLTIWRAVARLIGDRPLLGYGPEALELIFPSVYPPELVYYQGRGVLVDRAHNLLLDWAVTTGVAGVLAQAALLAVFFVVVWRAVPRAAGLGERCLLTASLSAVGGNIAGNLVSFDVTATLAATAVLMGMAVGISRGEERTLGLCRRRAETWSATVPNDSRRSRLGQQESLRVAVVAVVTTVVVGGMWHGVYRPLAADMAARISEERAAARDWEGGALAAGRAVDIWPVEPAYRRALSWACLQRALVAGTQAEPWLLEAEAELLTARALRPGDYRTWAALGELYAVWGNRWNPARLPLAHQSFARAVQLAPGLATLHTAWGMVDLTDGMAESAIAHFRRAVELDATDAYAFAHLGEAELAVGNVDEAVAAFGRAVHWEPRLVAAHAGLARCYWLQGRLQLAGEELRLALALDPNDSEALALGREMRLLP